MIPPISPALPPREPIFVHHSSTESKAHFLAIGILASVALLLAAPWEFAVPVSACILFVSLLFTLPLGSAVSVASPPLCVHTVQPAYVAPRILPTPYPPATPRPRVPIRIAPPSSARAPVGTGGRTPVAHLPSVDPAIRAPVSGGGRTPSQPISAQTQNPARAPVGRR